MTVAWLRALRECFGRIPESYLVVDTETTGLSHTKDLIVQVGWCEVQQRQVVDNGGALLNWFSEAPRLVDHDWLRWRLNSTRAAMEAEGNSYPWTERQIVQEGEKPLLVLADVLERLRCHCLPTVVTHNGWSFDGPMISSHFQRFLDARYQFPDHMWDTGALEKGIQLDMRPKPGDRLCDFSRRIMAKRSRVKWALANHCVPKYWLAQRFALDMSKAHTAPHDCLVTHHLLEVFREMIEFCEGTDLWHGSDLMKPILASMTSAESVTA